MLMNEARMCVGFSDGMTTVSVDRQIFRNGNSGPNITPIKMCSRPKDAHYAPLTWCCIPKWYRIIYEELLSHSARPQLFTFPFNFHAQSDGCFCLCTETRDTAKSGKHMFDVIATAHTIHHFKCSPSKYLDGGKQFLSTQCVATWISAAFTVRSEIQWHLLAAS